MFWGGVHPGHRRTSPTLDDPRCNAVVMTARYDTVADDYAGHPDRYDQPALASLLRLVDDISCGAALDLACGHGLLTRQLARRGLSVVGVDISSGLIEHARAIDAADPQEVTYLLGDASDPATLAGRTFDLVTSNFGLSDIDDLEGLFSAVSMAIRPGGRFVFSILHPSFLGSGAVSGSWPSGSTYYDERWWRADGELSTLRSEVGANHRMLSTYINVASRHGLHVHRIEEPEPEADWTTERPEAAAQPVYLVVDCRPCRTAS
jgi:SAM-dependent methyltransferase